MLRTYLTIIAVSLFLQLPADYAQAQEGEDPLFLSDEMLDVEIEAPFFMLATQRPDEEEATGKFRYSVADGNIVEFEIGVRTRGRLRRQEETCDFPPLRLNFQKSAVADTLFDRQDKLKLVTHCLTDSSRYEQSVLAEYLAYRILNILTDKSFRVRLLRTKYVATDKGPDIDTYAILIEHKDRLEKRLDAKTIDIERASIADIVATDLNLTSVFQYFLGNTDFSPVATAPDEDCCHNQVLFTREGLPHYTVPYDFDLSGFVDAPYAVPNPRFRLRSVRERLYRGRCVNNEHLPATLALFQERRSDIEQLINSQEGLSNAKRRSMLFFVDDFYNTIDNPKRVNRSMIKKCL